MEVFYKMNTTIKKILALGAIAVFAGTTAAHALTLADYPKPFVDAGVFGGKIVIGEKANVIDVLGATDIAASLQRDAATAAASSGTVVLSASGTTQDVLDPKLDLPEGSEPPAPEVSPTPAPTATPTPKASPSASPSATPTIQP